MYLGDKERLNYTHLIGLQAVRLTQTGAVSNCRNHLSQFHALLFRAHTLLTVTCVSKIGIARRDVIRYKESALLLR